MKIATQRLLRHICKPYQNATILHSTTKTSLCIRPSFKHFCVVELRSNRMYFSTAKNTVVEEPDDQHDNQVSDLSTYIKNKKTIQILQKKGIKSLFPIQIETFQAVYQSLDLLASDRTGSGKTIAYSLPIIEKLRDDKIFHSGKKQVKFLVMCPTRELTIQVYKQISSLRHSSNDFNVVAVYGGCSIEDQMRELRSGVDVIVATPGRLIDLVERKTINFSELVATCIDEADQMLEKGFKLDIEEIFSLIEKHSKQKTQNLMFSATIPDWVDKISNLYMDISMKKINLISRQQSQTSTTVEHLAVECSQKDRIKCIRGLIKAYNPNDELSTIIFSDTKLEVSEIAMEFGKEAAFLQGDMDQKERQFNLNIFRSGKRKILVATDVASRGLDIDNVGLVIQLGPPRNTEPFIHRAGRTGRAGRKGICVTMFERRRHIFSMTRIQNQARITFKHIAPPQMQVSHAEWEKKLNSIPHTLESFNKNLIINQQLNKMADLLISSHTDLKELVKRQLVAIAGLPPTHISLTSDEVGYKTYVIGMKKTDAEINAMDILKFIKTNFAPLQLTNVHVQSSNIIFDIPEKNLPNFSQILSSNTVQNSPYKVREAFFSDRQMTNFKQLARSNSSTVFGQRIDSRGGFRNDRRHQSLTEKSTGTLFIPGLPSEMQETDLVNTLKEMKIQYDSAKLKRKGQDNVFAFVQISDQWSFKQLLKKGIKFNDLRIRAFPSQKRQTSPSSSGRDGQNFRDNSLRRSSGYEKRNNWEDRDNRRGEGRSGRGQSNREDFDLQ